MCCSDPVLLEIAYIMPQARGDIENPHSSAKLLKLSIMAPTWDLKTYPTPPVSSP